jgi:hypothetical protein
LWFPSGRGWITREKERVAAAEKRSGTRVWRLAGKRWLYGEEEKRWMSHRSGREVRGSARCCPYEEDEVVVDVGLLVEMGRKQEEECFFDSRWSWASRRVSSRMERARKKEEEKIR